MGVCKFVQRISEIRRQGFQGVKRTPSGLTRVYAGLSVGIEQGQKDFAVILAKNRGTATSQTRLIRG